MAWTSDAISVQRFGVNILYHVILEWTMATTRNDEIGYEQQRQKCGKEGGMEHVGFWGMLSDF